AAVAVAAFCAFLPPATLPDGGSFPVGGYVAAFASLLGATILIATAIGPIASGLVPRLSHLPEVQHGLQRLRAASSRHRLGTAGLLVATGMALSMGIMTHSFERTLIRWLDVRFQADGFLFAPQSGGREYVPEEAISWFASQQEVDTVLPTSRFPVAFGGGTIQLEGAPYPEYLTRQQFLWLDEPRGTARIPPGADGSAIVSETFRYRFGLSTGDRVELETPDGRKQLWISGVKADYGSDRGLLQIGLDNLQAWYDLPGYTNATLYLNTDTELPLDTWQAQWPGLGLLSQAGLRETVLRVFNETFTVARGVQFLGLGVAFIGLALAMFTLIREDQASLRTLHALGLPRSRIARVLAAEAAGLAGIAGIGGLVLSLGLGALLVFVINRQSFGWTLQYELPWVNLLTQVLGIVVAGAATGALCGRFAGDLKLANRE
ncbi:MAG: ABC transporter permease, partial [Opitutales bacterium]